MSKMGNFYFENGSTDGFDYGLMCREYLAAEGHVDEIKCICQGAYIAPWYL